MKTNAAEALLKMLDDMGLKKIFEEMCKLSETKQYKQFADLMEEANSLEKSLTGQKSCKIDKERRKHHEM